MSVEKLCQAVEKGDQEKSNLLALKLMDEGADPLKIISSLTDVMEKIGEKFSRLEIFLPEMMMSGEAMSEAVDILKPHLKGKEEGQSKGKVILGTVKGDLHEIGKNIVKVMLTSNLFEVKDLGVDVDSVNFIKEAEAMGADIIGVSALMSTTLPHQKEIIDILKERGLREKFKVVIGGAPTTQEWADEIGADLYCPDAGSAPKRMADLIK
jgi:corrinoid protein of di/trimethylamine methyltransferase